jgi:regulator of ribonuclease activity A
MSNEVALQTPDICDEFPGEVQVVEPIFQNLGGQRFFCGEIVTIKCFEDNSLVKEQVNLPGEGRVLVVDGGGSRRCALMGDMLAESAVSNGWSGLVIYGSIRDIDPIRKMPLGVQALGVIPIKSVRKGRGDLNTVVKFAGVTFSPGNYVYADNNGIIVAEKKIV